MTLVASAALAYSFRSEARRIYLPGPTTSGHYQIELECSACHTEPFADRARMQEACVRCHGAELKAVNDSHPERKFTDPRNADRIAVLDARYCVTCHREHRPEITTTMGLSLPKDYCYRCHEGIAEERPSHAGMGFDTCADAGCHNFHDNQSLYEDFLARHLDDPPTLPVARNPARAAPAPKPERRPLTARDADAPATVKLAADELAAWEASAHARAAVNCSGCHVSADGKNTWQDSVGTARCGDCHEAERDAFHASRHGMKEAAGLGPMQVAAARAPMNASAGDRFVGCSSCHGAHGFDTRRAAVDACLECHADDHSRAYRSSRHYELWRDDPSGQSGASCATCHLPRLGEGDATRVHHNQNDTLRPNEKMVRAVCANCHGVGFALDALADPALIARNFRGQPSAQGKSLSMVRARLSAHGATAPQAQ